MVSAMDLSKSRWSRSDDLKMLMNQSHCVNTDAELYAMALDFFAGHDFLGGDGRSMLFRLEKPDDGLRLVAHRNVDPTTLSRCSRLDLGRCLCGRVAADGQMIVAISSDERHDIHIDGIAGHGHLVTPIVFCGRVIGVVNLFLRVESPWLPDTRNESMMFMDIAGMILASAIGRLWALSSAWQEKRDEFGLFVAGFAHEINNSLGLSFVAASEIRFRTGVLKHLMEGDGITETQLWDYLDTVGVMSEVVINQMTVAGDLVRYFEKNPMRVADIKKRNYSLSQNIQATLDSFKCEFEEKNVQIYFEITSDIVIFGRPGSLTRIMVNIIKNSLSHGFAGQDGGSIEINIHRDATMLEICYRDSGCGMSEDVLARITDPFFTTKKDAGGSGLGMYVVANLIAQDLQGEMVMHSAPGEGFEIKIRFHASLHD